MIFLKPLLRTLILSSILFFLVVFLGMKYHWVDSKEHKKIELRIPESNFSIKELGEEAPVLVEQPQTFHPEIINNQNASTLLVNMNKAQITESCQKLFHRTIKNDGQLKQLINNCIASNYQETFQNQNNVKSSLNRQQLTQKSNALRICHKQVFSQQRKLLNVERELLIGICVSNKMKRLGLK